jgi:S-adenosylmethionine:tRNA ribosyltransferase-isomerase
MIKDPLLLESYDYKLDSSLIAQFPHDPVDQCKLMIINKQTNTVEHQQFDYISTQLDEDYVVFLNNSKVVKARIPLDSATIINNDITLH